MIYIKWFFEYIYEILIVGPFEIASAIGNCIGTVFECLIDIITAFPIWLYVPFSALLSIAVLFRLSQFIPTIGGASD